MKVGCLLNIGIYFNQNLIFLSNINFRKQHVENSKLEYFKALPCNMVELIPMNKNMFTVKKKAS